MKLRWWLVSLLAAFLGMLALLVFTPAWGPGHSKESAKRTQTLSNLKRFAEAASMYADNRGDGRYPPGLVSPTVFRSIGPEANLPDQESLNKDSPHFLANSSLGGKRLAEIPDPDRTLLFFDSAPWPEGFRYVVFVNGSARKLSEKQFQAAVANKWVLPEEPK